MLKAWRIIKKRYVDHAFDGEGSRLYGSRWTSPGTRVAFASASLSLAILEVLVHLKDNDTLKSYFQFILDFSEDLVANFDQKDLPASWRHYPAPVELQSTGDKWARDGSSVILRVPSVLIPHESNFLINPSHRDFSRLKISRPSSLDIDPRLLKDSPAALR